MTVSQNDIVKVKNISKRVIHTSKGLILPGKIGSATVALARQLSKYLKLIPDGGEQHGDDECKPVKAKVKPKA